jgi:hypothetical protein
MRLNRGRVIHAQIVAHHKPSFQHRDDSATMPVFGMSHDMPTRAGNIIHIPTANESARKVRVLKSGIRRISYR